MNIDETIKTFPKHEAVLRDFFQIKKRIPDHRFMPAHSESQFLTILDELLLEPQIKEMYLKLRSEFDEPEFVNAITSKVCYYPYEFFYYLIEKANVGRKMSCVFQLSA